SFVSLWSRFSTRIRKVPSSTKLKSLRSTKRWMSSTTKGWISAMKSRKNRVAVLSENPHTLRVMNKYATIFTSHLFRLGMLKERSDIIDYILTLGGWESPEEVKVITLTGLEEQRKELDAIPTRSGFEDKQ